MKKYRQGDVYIFRRAKKKVDTREIRQQVLAEGEVTGHRHLLVAEPETKVRIANDGNGFYLDISGGTATVKHEEHAPITLTPGSYDVVIQIEYDPVLYQRRVMD